MKPIFGTSEIGDAVNYYNQQLKHKAKVNWLFDPLYGAYMKQMGFSTILVVKILDTNSSVRTNKGRHITSVSYRGIPISCRAFRDNYEPGQI